MRATGAVTALALVALACGCGDDDDPQAPDAGAPDAEPDAIGSFVPDPPAPAEPAALPVLTPCPAGWREVADEGWPDVVVCDPWPEGGPQSCDGTEAHFPGEPGCAPIGTSCPADGWPADIPEGVDVLYVDPEAPAGGDGGRDTPFETIADALEHATDGDLIALAAARHAGAVDVTRPVTILGACPERTSITAPTDEGNVVLVRSQGGVTLQNLTLEGATNTLRIVRTAAPSRLRQVVVRGSAMVPLVVEGGDAELIDVIVRDANSSRMGAGLFISGADVTLDHVVVERAGFWGVSVPDGSTVVGTAVVIGETLLGDPADRPGDGLLVIGRSTVELSESVVHDTYRYGVDVVTPGSTVTLRDTVVQDVGRYFDEPAAWALGEGISVADGAIARLERVLVERVHEGAVIVDGASVLEATDLVTRDVTPETSRFFAAGFGLAVFRAARATVRRAALIRSSGGGLLALDPDSDATVEDLSVLETRSASNELGWYYGSGVELGGGARVELHRADILENGGTGIYVGDDATVIGSDLRVAEGGRHDPELERAQGIVLFKQGHGDLQRVRLEGNRGCGLAVELFSDATIEDLEVLDTTETAQGHGEGEGITVDQGSIVTLTRARIERSHSVGVSVGGSSSATVEHLVASGTRAASCDPAQCGTGGIGLQVTSSGVLDVRSFAVRDNHVAGVQVAADGRMALHYGEVAGHPIGANIQDESFDPAELQDHVTWRDNRRQFDAQSLPVPRIAGAARESGGPGVCRGPRPEDTPLDVALEPIGAPLWEPRGFFQTSWHAADGGDIADTLTELLAPNHLFTELEVFWGTAHEPPYDEEWVAALRRARCASTATFAADEIAPPHMWTLFFVLVPTEGAPTGMTPEGADLPILSNDVYPLAMEGDLVKDGALFDGDFDGPWYGMEDLGPLADFYDGFSHQVIWMSSSTDFAPPETVPEGHYELDLTILDDTGNGWHIVSTFDAE